MAIALSWAGRLFLTAAVSAACLSAPAWAAPQVWDFTVFLGDKQIGTHRFQFEQRDHESVVTSTARFDAKFLLVYRYRYAHDDEEHWQGECLSGMQANTDDNGAKTHVEVVSQTGGLTIRAGGAVEHASGCVMSFAYWNPAILKQSHLLNAQTGEYEQVMVISAGREKITVRGMSIDAKRYALRSAHMAIDLWYSNDDSQWLALEATTRQGKRLIYRLN